MKKSICLAALAAAALLLNGCSTPTVIKVSGTPGTEFIGHYQGTATTGDIFGVVPARFELAGDYPEEFEFRKLDPNGKMAVEVWKGGRKIFRARVKPEHQGVRMYQDAGRRYEVLY